MTSNVANKEQLLDGLYNQMETKLDYVGSSAIEDLL
jgi:hypothetical protein